MVLKKQKEMDTLQSYPEDMLPFFMANYSSQAASQKGTRTKKKCARTFSTLKMYLVFFFKF